MGRRPQPNRRRGLLRAAGAVIGLIILLIIVVTVVSSLTAPTVKAPTVPPTAGPITSTPGTATPGPSTPLTRTPAARRTPAPSSTPKAKHKRVALGDIVLNDRSGNAAYDAATGGQLQEVSPAAQPVGHAVAYFARTGAASQHVSLLLRRGTRVYRIGYGDRFVRPVWSPDGHHLLFVHVAPAGKIPGERWTLMRWDERSNESRAITAVTALALTPLGWVDGHPLYSVAQPTTTDIYDGSTGGSKLAGTVLAQPLVDMVLSPNGRYVAFGAPDNCYRCTLDVFDLRRRSVWVGPTGMTNASALAWTADSRTVVGDMGGHLAIINPRDHTVRYLPAPPGLPNRWVDSMRAAVRGSHASLQDTVTGRIYADYGSAR